MNETRMSENLLPTVFVILGATGDLAQKKLIPALFHLYHEGQLPSLFQVVGFSREELSDTEFQRYVGKIIQEKIPDASQKTIEEFANYFVYRQGLFEEKDGYKNLAEVLGHRDGEWKVCSNKLFHLAVPPQFYKTILKHLAGSGLTKPCSPEEGWTRVIVEKPFGKDLATAQELDKLLGKLFREEQVYRIDHYLGKETVQNILAFRFSNSFLEPAWNAGGIESIRITLWEKSGIGNRGSFYDGVGALRDVGQNHILQLLALFTMENPEKFDAESVRRGRAGILRATHKLSAAEVDTHTIRAQYKGYHDEKKVDAESQTETYFRIQTSIDTPSWKNVPIYLESGKGMKENKVEVRITFRHPHPCLCPPEEADHYKNILHYEVQPTERMHITFWVKKPGPEMVLEEKTFTFDYQLAFKGLELSDAYERLLYNVIRGDQTLFVSTEEILEGWKFVDPIVRAWQEGKAKLLTYEKGSSDIAAIELPVDKK